MLISKGGYYFIFVVGVIFILIGCGFDSDEYKVDVCKSKVSRYVTAVYSQKINIREVDAGIAFDLNVWREMASDVSTKTTLNAKPETPKTPAHNKGMANNEYFDKFVFHTETKLLITVANGNVKYNFSEDELMIDKCLYLLDKNVSVKTWWDFVYSSDLDFLGRQVRGRY